MQHQLQKLLSKQKLKIWLIFVFALVWQLGPLAPTIQHVFATNDNKGDLSSYVKASWLSDNQIKVELTKDIDVGPGFVLRNQTGVQGTYTDSNTNDSNVSFSSGVDVCHPGAFGGEKTGQSTLTNEGGQWKIVLWYDRNEDDPNNGCNQVSGTIAAPTGGGGGLRDQFYWIDRTQISYKNENFKVAECNPYDMNAGYLSYIGGANGKDVATISDFNNSKVDVVYGNTGARFNNLEIIDKDGASKVTGYKLDDTTIFTPCGLTSNGHPEKAYYKLPDQNSSDIQSHPDKKGKFFRVGDGNVYFQDWIRIDNGPNATIHTENNAHLSTQDKPLFLANNGGNSVPPTVYGDVKTLLNTANSGGVSPGSGASQDIQCEWSVNPLTWLMCPLIAAANMAVNQLDAGITHELTIDTDQYLGDNQVGNSFKSAWSGFRYIALALLVIAALVMILSQALSIDILDAYTIKKVFPRLLVAILLISISWPLMKFAIDISNHLGQGVRALVYAPFKSLPPPSITGGTSTLGFLGVAAVGTTLGILGILSFVLTALLAVIIAFGVLVVRKMVILMLVIVAPIAIVAYILPGTQKVWKIWYDFFLRALLVFPIISLFIAAGRVFAQVAAQSDPGILGQFIVFVAYFGPYFALPTAFRLAGGAIANISGVVNDRGKGAFDRLSKYRSGRAAENVGKLKTGDRFQGRNAVARQFNKRSAGVASGWSGHFGVGARGEAFHDLHGRAAVEDAIRNDHNLRQLGYDDNAIAVMALSGGTRRGAERAADRLGLQGDARTRALETAAAVGFTNTNALAGITLMAQNKSRALTGALAGDAGIELVRQSAAEASDGNRQLVENTMGGFAFNSRGAGRFDLGGESEGRSMIDGWQRGSVPQQVQAFGASTQAFANHFVEDLHSGDHDQRMAAAVALSEMQQALPSASAENQTIINEALAAAGVNHNLQREQVVVNADGTRSSQMVPVSIEEQLANAANTARNRVGPRQVDERGVPYDVDASGRRVREITAADIQGRARQYGSATPVASRNPAEPPSAPKPPGTE